GLSGAVEPPRSWLQRLLMVGPSGPPDLGGRIASLLWDVQMQYSAAVEYMLLFVKMTAAERQDLAAGARRVVAPELFSLMRCCKMIREGVIISAEMRRRTLARDSPASESVVADEICEALLKKYPVSHAAACKQSCGFVQPRDCHVKRDCLVAAPVVPALP
ncbi:unnamed protein product, partial [Prorocentrum cordatum]